MKTYIKPLTTEYSVLIYSYILGESPGKSDKTNNLKTDSSVPVSNTLGEHQLAKGNLFSDFTSTDGDLSTGKSLWDE